RRGLINWKTGLVLLAVLAGLALYAYQTRPQGSPAPAATLVPCGAADTLELRLEQPGVAVLDLQRAAPGADWQILLPAPGAAGAVDQLNQALAKPPYRPSPSPAGSTGPSPTT